MRYALSLMAALLIIGCAADSGSVNAGSVPAVKFTGFTSSFVGAKELMQYNITFVSALKSSKKFAVVEGDEFKPLISKKTAVATTAAPNVQYLIRGDIAQLSGEFLVTVTMTDVSTGAVKGSWREKAATLQVVENAFWAIVKAM